MAPDEPGACYRRRRQHRSLVRRDPRIREYAAGRLRIVSVRGRFLDIGLYDHVIRSGRFGWSRCLEKTYHYHFGRLENSASAVLLAAEAAS